MVEMKVTVEMKVMEVEMKVMEVEVKVMAEKEMRKGVAIEEMGEEEVTVLAMAKAEYLEVA